MKRLTWWAAVCAAAAGLAAGIALAGERGTPQVSGDWVRLTAGEDVFAGNVAAVGTNGLAYAVNTDAVGGTLTVCGVFRHSAARGEPVVARRGGFLLENAGDITAADIGQTAYSATNNAWTVTKTSGGKTVGKVADVRDDGKVVVVVGK